MYYKGFTQATLPFVVFTKVAEDIEELKRLGFADENDNIIDGAVVTETQLTDDEDPNYVSFQFGICHKTINGSGNLIDRSQTEIDNQEASINKQLEAAKLAKVDKELDKGFFAYDSKEFPLNSGSRAVYEAVLNGTTGDQIIIASDGNYTLLDANREAFKGAYYDAIVAVKNNEVSI